MTKRIVIASSYSVPIFNTGWYHWEIVDSATDAVICSYTFRSPIPKGPVDKPEYYEAQRKVAQSIADALNEASNAYIEYIMQARQAAQELVKQAS